MNKQDKSGYVYKGGNWYKDGNKHITDWTTPFKWQKPKVKKIEWKIKS